MNKLDTFCWAILQFEGWAVGSRSWRNNNPGNLRKSVFECDNVEGYAVFEDFSHGWNALVYDVSMKCKGRTSSGLTPNSTILDFFNVYAPSSDNNHPIKYAQFVANKVEVAPESRIGDLLDETV